MQGAGGVRKGCRVGWMGLWLQVPRLRGGNSCRTVNASQLCSSFYRLAIAGAGCVAGGLGAAALEEYGCLSANAARPRRER